MKHTRIRAWAAGVAAVACVAPAGVAHARAEAPAASSAATVRVTLSEFKVAFSARSAPKGAVTFVVSNRGAAPHDFRIAGKKTAVLARGKSARLVVRFARAGRYPYVCTVAGHAPAGMKGAFAVR